MKRWELEVAYGKLQRENVELRRKVVAQSIEIADQRRLIEEQAADIAALKEAVEELRRAGRRQAGPFRRDQDKLSESPKPPGRKAGQGKWSRRAKPTDEEKVRAETRTSQVGDCPQCGGRLTERRWHVHYEWDVPPIEPVLIQYRSQSGLCPHCGRRFRSRHPEQISQATGAAGVVIGPRAKALASDMKHNLGLSYGKIAELFSVAFGLTVERSTWYQADMRVAARASPVYAELIALIRQAAQVHADETGWRIGTLSAWLWVFCNQEVTVYTIRTSRGHEVVLEILGERFRGVLTSDGLLTYDAAALAQWLKQKCLAHILRRLSELSDSRVAAHVALAEAATAVLRHALALAARREDLDARTYAEASAATEHRLDEVIARHLSDADDDGARMARHLTKHRAHLMRFLYVDGLAATNNQAERDLRPAVITRKTGGCNRVAAGAEAHAVLASIGATCRKRGIPVIDFLVQLQRSLDSPPSITLATPTSS